MQRERAKGIQIWRRLLDQGKVREQIEWEALMKDMYPRTLGIRWGQGESKNTMHGGLGKHERILWL